MRWGVVGDWAGSGDPAEVQHPHQIEGQCVPECGGLRLFQTADSKRVQAAVAAFGVAAFGEGVPSLIGGPGLVPSPRPGGESDCVWNQVRAGMFLCDC